jgi:hypothetical protein
VFPDTFSGEKIYPGKVLPLEFPHRKMSSDDAKEIHYIWMGGMEISYGSYGY